MALYLRAAPPARNMEFFLRLKSGLFRWAKRDQHCGVPLKQEMGNPCRIRQGFRQTPKHSSPKHPSLKTSMEVSKEAIQPQILLSGGMVMRHFNNTSTTLAGTTLDSRGCVENYIALAHPISFKEIRLLLVDEHWDDLLIFSTRIPPTASRSRVRRSID